MRILGWVIVVIVAGYFSACVGVSATKQAAYDSVAIGEARQAALDVFGEPDFVEVSDKPFLRYANGPCGGCREGLWFENKLTLGIEAWSIELDDGGRVKGKAHWMSP